MKAQEPLRPQPGRQTDFMSSPADIAVYGGGAGGGKSFALLLEGTRHIRNPLFRAVYFRRTSADLRKPKSLWDTSRRIYPRIGGVARDALLEWRFPSGAWIKMNHLENESDVFDHQGAEYDLIAFDELTHFTARQFWYLLSRNRSTSGVRPYVRGTCNPDPDSFVADLVAWYLDDEGFPRLDRAGVVRWFARDGDDSLVWGDSPADVAAQAPHLFEPEDPDLTPERLCLSFTFVPALLADNPALRQEDGGYRAKLRMLSRVERERLEKGNWNIRESAGEVFREEWYPLVDAVPEGVVRRVRYWDLAGSKRRRSDFVAGVLLVLHQDGTYTVEDVKNEKLRPKGTEDMLGRTAQGDGHEVDVHIEQEAVAAGELLIDQYQRHALRGFTLYGHRVRGEGNKAVRARPASAASEKGHVRLVRAPWNKPFLAQLQAFPDGHHDDMVDAFSGAFAAIQQGELAFATARTR